MVKKTKTVKSSERLDEIEKVNKDSDESKTLERVRTFLSDNIIEFDYKEKTYRVRRPLPKEREEVNTQRILKHTNLLSKKNSDGDYLYMAEHDLIKLYSDRGIDINGMRATAKVLNNKKESINEKLGKLLADDKNDKDQQTLKKEIENLEAKIKELSITISTYMDISIEQQVLNYLYSYLAYLTTEIKTGDTWKKAWKTYDEFKVDEEGLVNSVILYATLITNQLSNTEDED